MTSVREIERAVEELGAEDLAAFRDWFDAFDGERLDRRIAVDAAGGRLDRLAEEALADVHGGRAKQL